MATFRKGDRVAIEITVDEDSYDDEVRVKIDGIWGHGPSYWAKVDQLVMVKAEVHVGDQVEWTIGEKTYTGEVLAISDQHAWVHLGGGEYSTVWLSNARRVDPAFVEGDA